MLECGASHRIALEREFGAEAINRAVERRRRGVTKRKGVEQRLREPDRAGPEGVDLPGDV